MYYTTCDSSTRTTLYHLVYLRELGEVILSTLALFLPSRCGPLNSNAMSVTPTKYPVVLACSIIRPPLQRAYRTVSVLFSHTSPSPHLIGHFPTWKPLEVLPLLVGTLHAEAECSE